MAVAASYLQRADGRSHRTGCPSRRGAHAASPFGRPSARWAAAASPTSSIAAAASHARFAELLGAEPGVEILNDVVLNQVLGPLRRRRRTTREVVRRVQDDGTCWLGGTDWQGRAAMRISVSSFRTTTEDVDRSVAAI